MADTPSETSDALSLARVGGPLHDAHRREHCRFYLPVFELAFGPVGTWDHKTALVCFAGRGREAEFFLPYVQRLILTDNYPACLEMLRQRFVTSDRPYVSVQHGDGLLLPVESESVDILTALIALMHLRSLRVRESYAAEISRVLRPTGRALIQVSGPVVEKESKTRVPPDDGTPDFHYQVVDGGNNVGFANEDELLTWWNRFLHVEYLLWSTSWPKDAYAKNWWWLIATRR